MIRKILYCISYCIVAGTLKSLLLIFPNLLKRNCLGRDVFERRGINYITYRISLRRIELDDKNVYQIVLYGPVISVLFFLLFIISYLLI